MTAPEIEAWVDAACAALDLRLSPEERERVIGHFTRTVAIAAPLAALELPADVEPLPVFRP
ncbi:MAG TPA: DUF4089 domain-containing protein [Casimicrobiaceae bacterium]|nr:DUF4089 domain-containing protein [Casimicrobiaceae bacterium]